MFVGLLRDGFQGRLAGQLVRGAGWAVLVGGEQGRVLALAGLATDLGAIAWLATEEPRVELPELVAACSLPAARRRILASRRAAYR